MLHTLVAMLYNVEFSYTSNGSAAVNAMPTTRLHTFFNVSSLNITSSHLARVLRVILLLIGITIF